MKEHTLNVLSNYQKIHKVVCKRYTDFRINRYSSGGFMSEHIDNIHHSHGQQYGYPHLSVLLFLNEDYKGGEFVVADNEYKTSKGTKEFIITLFTNCMPIFLQEKRELLLKL